MKELVKYFKIAFENLCKRFWSKSQNAETTNDAKEEDNSDSPTTIENSTKKTPNKNKKPQGHTGRRGKSPTSGSNNPCKKPPPSRLELICRKVPGFNKWEVILTAGKKFDVKDVFLNGRSLDSNQNTFQFSELTGTLNITNNDGYKYSIPLIEEGKPLIFKLRKDWTGEGRRISKITNGYFIVVTPSNWERIGHIPVEPDDCDDSEFLAHYFYRDATEAEEDVFGFKNCTEILIDAGIKLTGERAFDDSDEGDLFVGEPPNLENSCRYEWARIGEEKPGGWGKNFQPKEEEISKVFRKQKCGRYYLRVYDSESRMLDSVSFRYHRYLKQIEVNGKIYDEDTVLIPTAEGHRTTLVSFINVNDNKLSIDLPNEDLYPTLTESNTIEVPRYYKADILSCNIGADKQVVNVVLNLPRVWWRLRGDCDDSEFGEWQDKPLEITRERFRNQAHSGVYLVVVSKRSSSINVGFDDDLNQVCHRNIDKEFIDIPLIYFVNYTQIDQISYSDSHFKIRLANKEITLILIKADPKPDIVSFTATPSTIFMEQEASLSWVVRNADCSHITIEPDVGKCTIESDGTCIVHPTDSTQYKLTLSTPGLIDICKTVSINVNSPSIPIDNTTPRVKFQTSEWRNGKGFSIGELRDAGLAMSEAVNRSIPIDKRRRSSHHTNVETIRRMLDACY